MLVRPGPETGVRSRASAIGLRQDWFGDRRRRGVATGEHAAVDGQRRPRDPRGAVACEEQHGLDDVRRHAVPAERVEGLTESSTCRACSAVMKRSYAGVSTNASATVFTRIPYCASSMARFFVSACRPAWAAEYALVGVAVIASTAHIEPTLTIALRRAPASPAPPPATCRRSGGGWSSSASSTCSSVCSRNGAGRKIPVLLTSTSTPPKRSVAVSISRPARRAS